MKRIILAVTNDLVHDQRMQRTARALHDAGAEVWLVGRCYADSPPLSDSPFRQHRLKLWFRSGILFYLEYQLRLFAFLWCQRADAYVAVDLDTVLPVTLAATRFSAVKLYDAHEWFTEVPELEGRMMVRWIWALVGRFTVPAMDACYTVGPALAELLAEEYGKSFHVVRNVPSGRDLPLEVPSVGNRIIWYQGALNKGRGLEEAIEALHALPEYALWIAGEGDLSAALRARVLAGGLEDRVRFWGWVAPSDLPGLASKASIGINLLQGQSRSYYFSLANKAFDYCQDLLPALHADFPEYRELDRQGPVGVLLDHLSPQAIVEGVRRMEEPGFYRHCQEALRCLRGELVWEVEKERLLMIYRNLQLLS